MARRVIDVTRRQVLVGLGGATLALPVLPSLLTRTAYGQDPTYTRRPRLYWVTTDHGGAFESNMFPKQSQLTQQTLLFDDHTVRHGALSSSVSGGVRSVSPVLSASSDRFSESLVSKMNVLYGLDVPFYIAHNTGLHLGNYARNNGDGGDGKAVQDSPRPTIDQLLAWSPSFYPDLGSIKERAMVMGSQQLSFNWSNPGSKSGNIENVRGNTSARDLFDRVFLAPGAAPEVPEVQPRKPVVDKVLEAYQRLRNGSRRLSAADKQRLDDHIDRIAELERKLGTVTPPVAPGELCGAATKPSQDAGGSGNDLATAARRGQLFNDVAVAAFACGTSRIGVMGYGSTQSFVGYSGDWHHDVAHMWQNAEPQSYLKDSYQRFFESVLLDIAAKLDVEEAPGMTYLDNTLVVWSQESGMETHGTVSVPIITFGSAAGFFKTGQFVDYRRTTSSASRFDAGADSDQYCGLLYGQWLSTVMHAMGLQPSEWELWDHKGYGVPFLTAESWTPPYKQHYQNTSSRYFTMSSDVLPVIGA
jgi:Protein of unknown function (DUF1552)